MSFSTEQGDLVLIAEAANALEHEISQLRPLRSRTTLFGGEHVGTFANRWRYYRFEFAENLLLRAGDDVELLIGTAEPISVSARIAALENQYLTLAVPVDFGSVIPRVQCSWTPAKSSLAAITKLRSITRASSFLSNLLHPPDELHQQSSSVPVIPPSFDEDGTQTSDLILEKRVCLVWGLESSGKTTMLAQLARSLRASGKTVLLLAPSMPSVERLCERMLEHGTPDPPEMSLGGIPSFPYSRPWLDFSLEHQFANIASASVSLARRLELVHTVRAARLKERMREDYYRKLADLQARFQEKHRQLEQIDAEIHRIEETIVELKSASIIERMKKGFSKDDIVKAEKRYNDKQTVQKRLKSIHYAINTEILKLGEQGPLGAHEARAYQSAMEGLDEWSGPDQTETLLRQEQTEFEDGRLRNDSLVASTVDYFFSKDALNSRCFDIVIVDDVERIPVPSLLAICGVVGERLILAGNPLGYPAASESTIESARRWMSHSIFSFLSRAATPDEFFRWAGEHPSLCVPLRRKSPTPISAVISGFMAPPPFAETSLAGESKLFLIDTSDLRSECKQYIGRKKILPYNDASARKAIELVKHALVEPRHALDIGIAVPFPGQSLHLKSLLRLHGIRNVEVGVPQFFAGRRKEVMIFDTVVAGLDYTMRPLDDRKCGTFQIRRMIDAIEGAAGEELYIIADVSHFESMYKDRAVTKLLRGLKSRRMSGGPGALRSKKLDELEMKDRSALTSSVRAELPRLDRKVPAPGGIKADHESEIRMKMTLRQEPVKVMTRNYEREIQSSVTRVLGLMDDVNMLSVYVSGNLLFNRTPATEAAIASLPGQSCESEAEFRKAMDQWNLLVYEMTEGHQTDVAFFSKQAPESRVRWDINNLKVYYSSDIEAIIEEGKHQLAVSVAKIFQECLGKSQPGSRVEWSIAYLGFLSKVEAYLSWISDQLRK